MLAVSLSLLLHARLRLTKVQPTLTPPLSLIALLAAVQLHVKALAVPQKAAVQLHAKALLVKPLAKVLAAPLLAKLPKREAIA